MPRQLFIFTHGRHFQVHESGDLQDLWFVVQIQLSPHVVHLTNMMLVS